MKLLKYELIFLVSILLLTMILGYKYYTSEKLKWIEEEYSQGANLYKQGEKEKALGIFSHIYSKKPEYENSALYLGKLYYYLRDFNNSYKIFKESYNREPSELSFLYWTIKSGFASSQKMDELITLCETYLSIDTTNAEVLYIHGVLQEKSGRLDLALVNYEESISKLSTYIPVAGRLSKIYSKAGLMDRSHWYGNMEKRLKEFSDRKQK
jgi:tetratricopeptide (TPR) repeat protein